MVDPCEQRTTHATSARPSTNLASSQKGSRRGRGGDVEKKEMGARENQKRRKQHLAHRAAPA